MAISCGDPTERHIGMRRQTLPQFSSISKSRNRHPKDDRVPITPQPVEKRERSRLQDESGAESPSVISGDDPVNWRPATSGKWKAAVEYPGPPPACPATRP